MMTLIRKKKLLKSYHKYSKNIKGLGGISTAKISKVRVGSGLQFC